MRAEHLLNENLSDEGLSDRVLWKLGFPKTRFGSKLTGLYGNVGKLREVVNSKSYTLEAWREEIRRAGVNLWVVLEDVLESALRFSCWVALKDHPKEGHTFNTASAGVLVAIELSGVLRTDQGPVNYSMDRKNTLYPLCVGFRALAQKLETLAASGKAEYQKPEIELAHYCHDSSLQLYPYRHTAWFFDMTDAERTALLNFLGDTSRQLEQNGVLSVRNRLDHHSEDFPTPDEVRACCDAILAAVTGLAEFGLIPRIFAFESGVQDKYGRRIVTSKAHEDMPLLWRPSPLLENIKSLPSADTAQII